VNLAACARLPTVPETRTWYRAIQPQFYATSLQTRQTRTIPTRFSAGDAAQPPFELLYLAEDPLVALFEVQALFGSPTSPGGVVPHPRRAYVVLNAELRQVLRSVNRAA
jgi:RES domain